MKLLIALISAGVYLCATYGLFLSIKKVRARDKDTTKLNGLMMTATLIRFGGWVLIGAAALQTEPIIGVTLIITRFIGTALKGYAILQKISTRPSVRLVLARLVPWLILLLIVAYFLATTSYGKLFAVPIQVLVGLSFVVYGFTTLTEIRRILRPDQSTFGMLLIFQRWMLANFVVSFILGFFSNDTGLAILMCCAYLVLSIEQGILVFLLERGRRRYRASKNV